MNSIELVKRAIDEEQSYTEMLHEATNKVILAVEPQDVVDYALSIGWEKIDSYTPDLVRLMNPKRRHIKVFIPMTNDTSRIEPDEFVHMMKTAIGAIDSLKP